ncbi:AraC family transcriptional regulator [Bradyrhizobium sp. SYSU BS000235]|uniref:AraC family transcriptional regulator n=1 Tax=Bradyrhizobium sp. SYSU BS000235 TaxID=3411332 RepID=UPI003C78A5C3
MINFSTDDFRPHERFDHWCEVRARNLFGVTISLDPRHRAHFRGRFSAVSVSDSILSNMRASPYLVSRGAGDISRTSSDSLCIYQQTGGASWFNSKGEGEFTIAAGELAISHSDLPYTTAPTTAHGFDLRILKIPLAGREMFARPARGLPPALLRDNPRLKMAIAASLAALAASATENPDADFDQDVGHLAQLALLARNRVAPGSPESRAALRSGVLKAATSVLAQNLHRPGLSPLAVATELGISVRQLHLLFEPTGRSFARTLMALRLTEARRVMLGVMSTRPVADVAYACGFDSMATFYRVFRQTYGMTPNELRAEKIAADVTL